MFSFLHDAMKRRSYVEFEMWVGRNYVRDNGKTYTIDAPPFIQDGRTMVPIRPIGDALGAEVIWYPNDKRIAYSLKTQFVQILSIQIKCDDVQEFQSSSLFQLHAAVGKDLLCFQSERTGAYQEQHPRSSRRKRRGIYQKNDKASVQRNFYPLL